MRIWNLEGWTFDWTGEKFERTSYLLPFEKYEGHKAITALPFYPLDQHVEYQSTRDDLVERGKLFRKVCEAKEGERLFEYSADSIFDQQGFTGLQSDDDTVDSMYMGRRMPPAPAQGTVTKPTHTESRVMVDHQSYFQYGPPLAYNGTLQPRLEGWACGCTDCVEHNKGLAQRYRIHFDSQGKSKKWDDEMYLLCPPRALGYILKDKQWAQLQVTKLESVPPKDTKDAWNNRLQLADKDMKKLLFDLVQSHVASPSKTSEKEESSPLEVDDIVPGKGKGLVILLYGPPGVGKTSTAETIAVATRKPLFSISVADVGTKAKNVEANLRRIFSLASAWKAILLIDEADVFLESRGRGAGASMDRNALVSVFLRVLEYYDGIMFLTTNQIAQFDVAIPSRIHVSIPYGTLKTAQMKGIFKGFLQPLDDRNLIDRYDDILEWLEEDVYSIGFDGRQIRNIITTALGLARAESRFGDGTGKLHKRHLKSVVSNARLFKTESIKQFERYKNSQDNMIH